MAASQRSSVARLGSSARASIETDRFRGGWQPLPVVFFAPVPEVLQIRSIRSNGVLRLGLGGKVPQPAQALLELPQALGLLQGFRSGSALRAVVWAFPRVGSVLPDL
jgi:hypothetical protein